MQTFRLNVPWLDRTWGLSLVALLLPVVGSLAQCTSDPSVPNDCFQNTLVISGQWGSTNASNVGATAQPGEPAHGGFAASNSIWFKWIAPEDGEVTFDTMGSLDS